MSTISSSVSSVKLTRFLPTDTRAPGTPFSSGLEPTVIAANSSVWAYRATQASFSTPNRLTPLIALNQKMREEARPKSRASAFNAQKQSQPTDNLQPATDNSTRSPDLTLFFLDLCTKDIPRGRP